MKQATRMLGVGSTTLKRWANENRIPCSRTVGGHRRFRVTDVQRLSLNASRGRSRPGVPDEAASAGEWMERLTAHGDNFPWHDQIFRLHEVAGDWFDVADFLNRAVEEIAGRRNDADRSATDRNATIRDLGNIVDDVAASFRAPRQAPVGLLASMSDEQDSLELSLMRLCLKSAGIRVARVAGKTPVPQIISIIRTRHQNLVGLAASRRATDTALLAAASRQVAAACQDRGVEMVCVGDAWPEPLTYGYRSRSFAELRGVLERTEFS